MPNAYAGSILFKDEITIYKIPALDVISNDSQIKELRVRFIKIPFKPLSNNNEEEIVVSLSISKIKIILSNSFLITAA